MYAGLKQISSPAVPAVTIAELKKLMGITSTYKDDVLTDAILAATDTAEKQAFTAFVNRPMIATFDYGFPCVLRLPISPVYSVTSVKYYDVDGILQTLASNQYRVLLNQTPVEIVPTFDGYWADTICKKSDIEVEFIAGYGTTAADVPATAKALIKQLAAALIEQVESSSEVNLNENPAFKFMFNAISRRHFF